MLVLRFKSNAGDKSILCISDPRIGHDVTVTVIAIRGELVELAVDAPAGVAVTRQSSIPSRRQKRIAASNADELQSSQNIKTNLLSSNENFITWGIVTKEGPDLLRTGRGWHQIL